MSEAMYDPNQRYTVSVEQKDGDAIIHCEVEPGGGVPTHTHPNQDETFTILEGKFKFRVGGKRVVLGPGEKAVVPAGTKHWFKNVGDQNGRHEAVLSPALDAEGFFVESIAMAREGLITRGRRPTSFRAAVRAAEFINRYRDDVALSFPPRFLLAPLLLFSKSDNS
jgi:quercetin dioxygenase-like cupin family protein